MKFLLIVLLLILQHLLLAQGISNFHDEKGYYCRVTVENQDTLPIIYFDGVNVAGSKSFRNSVESRQWERLVRNVKIAYPYAKIAGIKFNEYSQTISALNSEREKREMMKKAENELEAQFGNELKELTFTQGKILLKLIDRQTSNCSYEIIKEFRGSFRAFFYQSFARLFGFDLKVKYDPNGEDADIEKIVLMIENGTI